MEIELSNAIKISNIENELMNQKRMQVELCKPENYKKYLDKEEDIKLLESSFVEMIDFDGKALEEYKTIVEHVSEHPEKYILKPNAEGGGNNLFGYDCVCTMKKL